MSTQVCKAMEFLALFMERNLHDFKPPTETPRIPKVRARQKKVAGKVHVTRRSSCRISIQGLYHIIRNSGKRSCWNLQFSNDFRTVLILIFRVPQIQGSV
jgi:hypothetical protein